MSEEADMASRMRFYPCPALFNEYRLGFERLVNLSQCSIVKI